MEKYFNQIKNCPLFFGMQEEEVKTMLTCFNAKIKKCDSNEMVVRQGDLIRNIYVILDGSVNIEKDSYWGHRIIVSKLGINENIALGFVASRDRSNVDAVASKGTVLLIMSYEKCTTMCQNVCTKHKMLIGNMFEILSKENVQLIQKIENISQKSIRDKLFTYFSNEAQKNRSNSFEIVFNRQELADYLNIDRSAMCFELSKLQKEGFIEYEKNKFVLHAQM